MAESVPNFQLEVDKNSPLDDIKQMLQAIRPTWTYIEIKQFTDGLTNHLFGVWEDDTNDMILFRIFGCNSEKFIDRKTELESLLLLCRYGCTKPVYATFNNGMCYGFVPGRVLDIRMMRDWKYGEMIAKEMARLHTVPVPENYAPHLNGDASFFHGSRAMIRLMPERLEKDEDQELYERVIDVEKLKDALVELEEEANTFNEDLVLCHHDLMERNIVYNEDEERTYFIDYEYTGPGHAAMDIGCHFICLIGMDDPDINAWPSKERQIQFLTTYLVERNKYTDKVDINDELLDTWYKRVNKMALISYLYWGLWLILQHHLGSDHEFGFLELGCLMIDRFFEVKDETMAL